MSAVAANGSPQRPTTPEHPVVDRGSGAPWTGWAAAGLLVVLTAATTWLIVHRIGEFAYPLDDPYIHLRLGENLARDFVLGINPGQFASAGSSTIWPLAIAAVTTVTGPLVEIPLALDLVVGAFTLVLVDRWARRLGMSVGLRLALHGGLLFVVPVLLMVSTGMEHVLQIGLSILLVDLAVEYRLATETRARSLAMLGATVVLLGFTRPEVLFVAAVVVVVLASGRKFRAAAVVGMGALVPFVVVALVNMGQGWPPLAASISAKSIAKTHGIMRLLPRPEYLLVALRVRRLIALLCILGIILFAGRKLGGAFELRSRLWIHTAAGITGLHILYSQTGWLYRYEAYLVALCICAAAVGLQNLSEHRTTLRSMLGAATRRWMSVAAVFLALVALVDGARIEVIGLMATQEIHDQQGSMARFAARACPGCRVVLNDIGMVSLYGDNRVTDSYGLSDLAVLEAKLDGDYTPGRLDRIARAEGAQWAMVYDAPEWTPVPDSWLHVGDWTWHRTHVLGAPRVSVFVIDPTVEHRIRTAFEHYQPEAGDVSPG